MKTFEEYQHYMESYYLSNDNAKSRRKILQDAYDITHDKITELEQKLERAKTGLEIVSQNLVECLEWGTFPDDLIHVARNADKAVKLARLYIKEIEQI